jgi:predicted permease
MAWLDSFAQDLRYGARQLLRTPGFTAVAVLSLALGIGANTAIFQLVDAVRLRTLPVEEPQNLVYINFAPNNSRSGWWSSRSATFTSAHWQQIQSQQQAFTGVIAWSASRFNLAQGGEVRNAEGLFVSADFFRHLGVTPVLGRTFTSEDDTPTCSNPGTVISYAFWQREFGGEPSALGRTVSLDGHPFPVIGITPESFFGVEVGNRYEVAIPLCADQLLAEDKTRIRATLPTAWWLSMMGRLKPGWSVERADAHLKTLSPGIMRATLPPTYRPDNAKLYLDNKLEATQGGTGVSGLRRQYERPLWLLLAITGLVLLIACANLANLLLARASVREREIAVRLAIGASRGRLVRQLLAESLLLAVLGAAFGAVLAQVLSRGLVAFLTTTNNRLFVGLGIDWRVLGFTATLAVTTCLLFGLLPALRATHLAPASAIRAGARGTTAGRERFGLRRALVSTQVALSLVLLVGALLFVRSLQKLLAVDPGFQSEGILAVSLDLRRPNYPQERRPVVYRDLLERVSTRPGVLSAAQVGMTPMRGGWNQTVRPEGAGSSESGKNAWFNRVSPGYFRTMGTTLIAGRDFDERDTLTSPKVAIVNEAFAKTFFGGANPVGHSFRYEASAGEQDPVFQIVGLVKNTKYYELREDPREIGFFPIAQEPRPGAGANYVIRVAGSMGEVMRNVTGAVGEVSPAIGIEFTPLSRQIKDSLMRDRLMATLSGSFGLLAGLLATLGLYGVISYMVARRRNEIGVRIALGADRSRVIGMVLREAGVLLAVGIGVGLLLAVGAARAATTLLFGLQPHDPVTLISAVLLLAVVALAASYAPARRAAALEPMQALRDE